MNWNWKFRAVWILCLGVNDMSREMKDSGVEWIGEIPKNWNVQRVKNAFVRKKAEAHQENPVVLSLARAGVKVRDLSKNEGQIAESYYNYNLVEFGDLLLNPMDLYSGANCSISMVEGDMAALRTMYNSDTGNMNTVLETMVKRGTLTDEQITEIKEQRKS